MLVTEVLVVVHILVVLGLQVRVMTVVMKAQEIEVAGVEVLVLLVQIVLLQMVEQGVMDRLLQLQLMGQQLLQDQAVVVVLLLGVMLGHQEEQAVVVLEVDQEPLLLEGQILVEEVAVELAVMERKLVGQVL